MPYNIPKQNRTVPDFLTFFFSVSCITQESITEEDNAEGMLQ